MVNVHDEPESPYEEACLRYESESRNEGACYMFKIYDEPESPSKGTCSTDMMTRNRQ